MCGLAGSVMIPGGLRGKDDDDARRETEVPRKRSEKKD